MAKWEIWTEGYLCSGASGEAQKIGDTEAETFHEACDIICSPMEWQNRWGNYDRERLTVWGCRLFDNEIAARRSFG